MTSGWYAAMDRIRAYWMVNGGRADLVAAGILLVLAAAAFAADLVLR
ncbi:hypothetical protein [Kribbella sp. NPDC004875]